MIDRNEITALMTAVSGVVQRFFAKASTDFQTKIAALELRLESIPAGARGEQGAPGVRGEAGPAGEPGTPGETGPQGPAGKDGVDGKSGPEGEQGPAGAVGAPGPQGEPGPAGAQGEKGDAGDPGPAGERGPRGEAGSIGPQGDAGLPGADGARGEAGPTGDRGLQGEIGPRGEAGIPGNTGKDGKDGRDGRDGESGRDALELNVLSGIDASKSYPRGTYAEFRGGLIRAQRATDPLGDSLDGAGWSVVLNGVAEETEEMIEDGRTLRRVTVYTNGRRLQREFRSSVLIYRGLWRDGEHQPGDVVTWNGSAWHCQQQTTDKPDTGTDTWKLMVKRGQNGKDGAPPAAAAAAPVVRVK